MGKYYVSEKHFLNAVNLLIAPHKDRIKDIKSLPKIIQSCYYIDSRLNTYKTSLCSMFYFELKKWIEQEDDVFRDIYLNDIRSIANLSCANYVYNTVYYETINLSEEDARTVGKVTNKSGIYYLYDEDKLLIYIGKSVHIGTRMMESARDKKAKYCRFSQIGNMADMGILEPYMISKYKPKHNKEFNNYHKPTIVIKEPEINSDFIEIRGIYEPLEP